MTVYGKHKPCYIRQVLSVPALFINAGSGSTMTSKPLNFEEIRGWDIELIRRRELYSLKIDEVENGETVCDCVYF